MKKGELALFNDELSIPEDLAIVLKDLVKEILREGCQTKDDIVEFSKKYFEKHSTG